MCFAKVRPLCWLKVSLAMKVASIAARVFVSRILPANKAPRSILSPAFSNLHKFVFDSGDRILAGRRFGCLLGGIKPLNNFVSRQLSVK